LAGDGQNIGHAAHNRPRAAKRNPLRVILAPVAPTS